MKDTILFDLDGTLVDSLADLMDGTNYALDSLGHKKRNIDEIRKFVGNGADMLIKRALTEKYEADFDKAIILFKKYYNANICNKTKPYDGIDSLLHKLKNDGYKIGIVTNKPDDSAKLIENKLFSGIFDVVVGADLSKRNKKPQPDAIDYALSVIDSSRDKTIYIGDSEVDVQTAKNANIDCIGVSWGFRSVDDLVGANKIVDNVNDLYNGILELSK